MVRSGTSSAMKEHARPVEGLYNKLVMGNAAAEAPSRVVCTREICYRCCIYGPDDIILIRKSTCGPKINIYYKTWCSTNTRAARGRTLLNTTVFLPNIYLIKF